MSKATPEKFQFLVNVPELLLMWSEWESTGVLLVTLKSFSIRNPPWRKHGNCVQYQRFLERIPRSSGLSSFDLSTTINQRMESLWLCLQQLRLCCRIQTSFVENRRTMGTIKALQHCCCSNRFPCTWESRISVGSCSYCWSLIYKIPWKKWERTLLV